MAELNIPTNQEDRKKLKAMIVEMTNTLSRVDAEREHLKEIAAVASDEFGIQKKIINKLARTMYKNNYTDLQQENQHFEFLYESLVDSNITPGE
jgi:hypothetical protein